MGLFFLKLLRLLCLILLLSQVFCGSRTLARRLLQEDMQLSREMHQGRPHDKPLPPRRSSPRFREDYRLPPGSNRP
ncbi:hypothetical protein MKW94_018725 [Papaver nudicaule]|uniref:Uncharacterized protein n=1 Tax=Papaver nudicaule TaxID=74823 RepID=A0AA41VW43_PAPNU|nr:hypothetical protein [Papaver nudicaule]